VLFSEPKIPQFRQPRRHQTRPPEVSVLFSEPKIPQSRTLWATRSSTPRFSALQRAENSSIPSASERRLRQRPFQCSSASRKFLNASRCSRNDFASSVSVLFSEPKIPQ